MESFLAALSGHRGDDATAKAQDVMYDAWERTSAGIAAARTEGRVGGRRKKLDAAKRREIAESVITGRKSGAEMARLYHISQPTVSRIVAQHRTVSP
jgi:DNA invertase Pin-like site-specific DNA recombinase